MCPKMAAILDLWPFGGHKKIFGTSHKESTCQISSSYHVWCPNECSISVILRNPKQKTNMVVWSLILLYNNTIWSLIRVTILGIIS